MSSTHLTPYIVNIMLLFSLCYILHPITVFITDNLYLLICNGPMRKDLSGPGKKLNDISKMNHCVHRIVESLPAQRTWESQL